MKKQIFYGLTFAVLAVAGYMVGGYTPSNMGATSTLTLSNLDALSNPENSETSGSETGSGSNTGSESGSNTGSGSGFEYPNGWAVPLICGVPMINGQSCTTSIVICQGGGQGCTPRHCPLHP